MHSVSVLQSEGLATYLYLPIYSYLSRIVQNLHFQEDRNWQGGPVLARGKLVPDHKTDHKTDYSPSYSYQTSMLTLHRGRQVGTDIGVSHNQCVNNKYKSSDRVVIKVMQLNILYTMQLLLLCIYYNLLHLIFSCNTFSYLHLHVHVDSYTALLSQPTKLGSFT